MLIFSQTGSVFQVTNPANAEIIAEVASCGVAETESAIDAAEVAFKTWRKMTPKARGALVAKWGDLITANADKIGAIITFENGKPLGEGKGEANYSGKSHFWRLKSELNFQASFCEWAAAEGRRVHGETMSRKRSLLPQVSYLSIHLTFYSDLPQIAPFIASQVKIKQLTAFTALGPTGESSRLNSPLEEAFLKPIFRP